MSRQDARPRIDAETVREAARGRWPDIHAALGISRRHLQNRHGPCPGCGGRDRFRYDNRDRAGTFLCSRKGGEPLAGDGFALLQHVKGWSFRRALSEVADFLGIEPEGPQPAAQAASDGGDAEAKAARAREIWAAARPLEPGSPALRYLDGRGLPRIETSALGYHPSLRHGPTGRDLPALVAAATDGDGTVTGIQRIYVEPDGRRLDHENAKLSLGPVRGAATKLAQPYRDELALVEGPEDAIAVQNLFQVAAWATLGTSNARNVPVPDDVTRLYLAFDAESGKGDAAARAAAAAHARDGREILRLRPPVEGTDWADWCPEILERAAIRQFDGGLSRREAREAAIDDIVGGAE